MQVLFADSTGYHVRVGVVLRARTGWSVHCATSLSQARRKLDEVAYRVVFIVIPADRASDALEICRFARFRTPATGRIVLTEADCLERKLAAFDAGADDCVLVDSDPSELGARAMAVARRSVGLEAAAGDSWVPLTEADASSAHSEPGTNLGASLTPTEAQLLARLARCGQQGVSTVQLATELLRRSDAHAENLIHRHVSNLRRKLRAVGAKEAVGRSRSGYVLTRA
jgi:DNA-binding response OmpR family regulator